MTARIEQTPAAMVVKPGAGKRVHVLGAEITIKVPSRATERAFAVFQGRIEPRQGPPLHRHSDHDEWWYIIEGEFRFVVDGEETRASAGDVVYARRGTVHTFQNIGSGVGHVVTTVVPGGVDEFFEDLEKVAPRGTRPNPFEMLPVFERHGQELLGPPLGAPENANRR